MVRWMGGEILRVFGELGVPKCRSRADLEDPRPDFLHHPASSHDCESSKKREAVHNRPGDREHIKPDWVYGGQF